MKIKNVTNIKYFDKGSRGLIYTGKFKNKKVAIKIKNPNSEAIERIKNEIKFLEKLNKKKIGPKLLLKGKDYFVYEFQEGSFLIDWIKTASLNQKKKVLKNLILQCFKMDELGINKEEMLRPFKNVIVTKYNVPVLIDFERCHYSKNEKNVSQLIQFMLKEKLVSKKIIPFIQKYKVSVSKKNFNLLIKKLF